MNWTSSSAGIKSIVITLSFVFLFIVAVLLDLPYLYLMAVTLAVLPLSSYALTYFFASRYTSSRQHPDTVSEGRRVEVRLFVAANGGLPPAALRVADQVPGDLLKDVALGSVSPNQAAPLSSWDGISGSRTYTLEPAKRGVYTLGPARLETTDPLGLFSFPVALTAESHLTVHPSPIAARENPVGGEGSYGVRERDGRTRRGEGMDFHGVREYRMGDALRRVHWPTTARRGKLAVVEFERAYQQDIVIGLDLLAGTNIGSGRETTLEYAIKIAATLAERTLRAGGGVTLVTQAGKYVVSAREGDREAARFALFDHLARIEADSSESLASSLLAARFEEGAYYAILTAQGDPRLTAFLSRRVQHGDEVRVYYLEPSSFGGSQQASPAVAGAGLRIVTREHDPWKDGGKALESLLSEST